MQARLIGVEGSRARLGQRALSDDEDWALLGIDLGVCRLVMEGPDDPPPRP